MPKKLAPGCGGTEAMEGFYCMLSGIDIRVATYPRGDAL